MDFTYSENFTPPPTSSKGRDSATAEIQRLRDDSQLKLSYNNLLDAYNAIIYQNVRSLCKNLTHILSDHWYMRSEILCFSETYTIPSDEIIILGYVCFYRSDAEATSRKPRGLMCFIRSSQNIPNVIQECNISNRSCHIDLVAFAYQDTAVVMVYSSPSTSVKMFTETLLISF